MQPARSLQVRAAALMMLLTSFSTAERVRPHGGEREATDYDVIVVGGGISGLSAARQLLRAGKRVLLLEARGALGGRSARQPVRFSNGTAVPCGAAQCVGDGTWWFDLGGQWLGRTHTRLQALAKEFKVQVYEAAQVLGKLRLYINGKPVVVSPVLLEGGDAPPADLAALSADQAASLKEFNRLAGLLYKIVDSFVLERPWETPGAQQLDSTTFDSWLRANSNDTFARDMLTWLYPLNHGLGGGLKPGWLSVLEAARQLKSGPLEDSEKWLFWGAAAQFVKHLAEDVTRLGGAIQVGAPVRHISQSSSPGGTVAVRSDCGTFRGSYAILAMPPHLTGRITFDPPPPALRSQLAQRAAMGSTVKMLAFYERPFWRASGGIKQSITTAINPDPAAPVSMVFDVSPPEGPGVLASFLFADHALQLPAQGPQAVESAALEAFVQLLDDPAARHPLNFVYVDWPSEQWTGGAYAAFLPPGGLTTFGAALYEPMGRVHWAGTEASRHWPGYYEGALEAAEVAAAAVLRQLEGGDGAGVAPGSCPDTCKPSLQR